MQQPEYAHIQFLRHTTPHATQQFINQITALDDKPHA